MDRKRRSLLWTMALAGSAGLAGCFSRSSPGADPTESPGETGTSPTASPQSSETTHRVITTGSPATERRTPTLTVGDTWSVDDLGELSEYDAVTVGDGEPDVGYLLSYASGGETVNTGAEIRLVE